MGKTPPQTADTKEIICIVCPKGCRIQAAWREGQKAGASAGIAAGEKELELSGYSCEHGREYAREEYLNPMRFFTGTAAIEGAVRRRLPVRTDQKIPRDRLQECAAIAAGLKLQAPVSLGEPLTGPLFGTNARIVASMTLEEEEGLV